MFAQINNRLNVTYRLTDRDGNLLKLFQENALFRFLMKHGIVSPLFPKIPLLLGYWAGEKKISNLVTNVGFAAQAGRTNGSTADAAFTYIALGIGTTAAAVTDTALGSEITTGGLARIAATAARKTTTVTNDTATLTNTFTASASFAVTESGVFNAASLGTLLCHQVFAAINMVSGNNLQVEWDIQQH